MEVSDFEAVARDLPRLVAPLQPLSEQWNPLSPFAGYMLMLQGAVKVDLNFEDQPREFDPPWSPGAGTLAAIDRHFWDWIRWMAAKHVSRSRLLRQEVEEAHPVLREHRRELRAAEEARSRRPVSDQPQPFEIAETLGCQPEHRELQRVREIFKSTSASWRA